MIYPIPDKPVMTQPPVGLEDPLDLDSPPFSGAGKNARKASA